MISSRRAELRNVGNCGANIRKTEWQMDTWTGEKLQDRRIIEQRTVEMGRKTGRKDRKTERQMDRRTGRQEVR